MTKNLRNGSIDYARFVGALAIVWFHLHMPGASTALAALPMFVLFQTYFGFDRPLRPQVSRLLVPWAIWSALYAFGKIAQAIAEGTPISAEFAAWMFLTGTSIHLWYLPFSVAILAVLKILPKLTSWTVIYLIGTVFACLSIYLANTARLEIPLAQWVTVVPAATLGLFMKGPVPILLVLGVSLAGTATMAFGLGWDSVAWQTLVTIMVFAVAMKFRISSTALSAKLSGISFGIYLVHPAVYSVVLQVLAPGGLLAYVAVIALSTGLTLLLQKGAGRLQLV